MSAHPELGPSRRELLAGTLAALAAPLSMAAGAAGAPLALRGAMSQFPFWLGTTFYGNQWKTSEEGCGWWFDRSHWQGVFAEMEGLRLNALALTHPHPFPALVDVPGYPEAQTLPADNAARTREMAHWIVAEGLRHDVRLYFLTWNICLLPAFCAKHGIEEFGADTPLSRDYMRRAIASFFREYPDFGGLITEAAETPPGCVDFVEKAVCAGLRDSGTDPELIFWGWCSYPEDSTRIRSAYANTRLLHYLQYEQFFKPMADPRIGRFSRACGNAPMIVLGGPKSCHGYLYWGDPEWAQRTAASLGAQNVDGWFIETYHEDPAISRESLAYYAFRPKAAYDSAYWARRAGAIYGRPDLGRPLLDTMQRASRIMPRVVTLLHSQTDHFSPQFGLPLVYFLEMPTLSSYIFENVQTVDSRGYLRPNLGLCWPNPDWGEAVASVKEFVGGTAAPGASTPLTIAAEIAAHAAACRAGVASLRFRLSAADGAYIRRLLDLFDLNAALGDHFAVKIRAAVEWQRFKTGSGRAAGAACVALLAESVAAWERVATVSSRVHPDDVGYWRSELAAPPPWTQMQIWDSYAMAHGHWRDNLEPFRRELDWVRREVEGRPGAAQLPLWESLRAVGTDRLRPVFADDFERRDEARWVWDQGATLTHRPEEVLSGSGAACLDSRGLPGEWHMALRWRPGAVRLKRGRRYQVTFRYRVIDPGKEYSAPFAVAARSEKGGVPADIGTGRTWGAHRGAVGARVVLLEPRDYDDYALFFSIHGAAALVIYDFSVGEIRE